MPDPRDLPGDEAEDAYDPEYLREVAGGDARQERLEELQRRKCRQQFERTRLVHSLE